MSSTLSTIIPSRRATYFSLLLASGTVSCNDFLQVEIRNVVDAETIDPGQNTTTFSLSARQNLATAYGRLALYSAYFTGELLVGNAGFVNIEFGGRLVSVFNAANIDTWRALSMARASATEVLTFAQGLPDVSRNVDVARAALVAGYAFLFMAEQFCSGAVDGGPLLTPAQVLDSAVAYFTRANTVASAAAQATPSVVEASQLAAAALVGRSRAQLQAGRKAQAVADADLVPVGFVYALPYIDDPSNRPRLGNLLWNVTESRSAAVAPAFQNLSDPRVPVSPPTLAGALSADGVTPFWRQDKYASYGASMRLASRIEADYVAAEGRGSTAMLTLIGARRSANGQPSYGGPTDDASVLKELMVQRARDFFLEGMRLGDFRRHPTTVPYMPVPGAPFHKLGYPPIGDQVCYPLPAVETIGK